LDIQQEQVLHLSQKSHKNWVEVDSDKAFLALCALLSVEQELVELVVCVLLDSLLPRPDLLLVVLIQVLA
jgi:hypothetical protein